jgi:predicted nucleic acid-binding Zn ribbon protein
MNLSKKFVAEYECLHCGEIYDVEGMFFPEIVLPCDGCGYTTRHVAKRIIQSIDLDYLVETEL